MRILIIDDEEFYLDIISRYLSKKVMAGIECITSANAALELVKNTKYDLIISDLRLPGMYDGELVIKINKINPGQLFFIASAFSMPEQLFKQKKINVAAYFEKPFDMDLMYKQLQQVMRGKLGIDV